jgi:hypothetical protein
MAGFLLTAANLELFQIIIKQNLLFFASETLKNACFKN